MKLLSICAIMILLGCRSQNNNYQDASSTRPKRLRNEVSLSPSPSPSSITKGAIQLAGFIKLQDNKEVVFEVKEVIGIGSAFNGEIPTVGDLITLSYTLALPVHTDNYYYFEIRLNPENKLQGRILKTLETD